MTHSDLLKVGTKFQNQLANHFKSIGYEVELFGQEYIFPKAMKTLQKFKDLSARPSLLRHLPDFLVSSISGTIACIDAKTTFNHNKYISIEMDSFEVCKLINDRFFTPTFFVIDRPNYGVLTIRDIEQRRKLGPYSPTNGSGDPYWLIDPVHVRCLSDFFPGIREFSEHLEDWELREAWEIPIDGIDI